MNFAPPCNKIVSMPDFLCAMFYNTAVYHRVLIRHHTFYVSGSIIVAQADCISVSASWEMKQEQ